MDQAIKAQEPLIVGASMKREQAFHLSFSNISWSFCCKMRHTSHFVLKCIFKRFFFLFFFLPFWYQISFPHNVALSKFILHYNIPFKLSQYRELWLRHISRLTKSWQFIFFWMVDGRILELPSIMHCPMMKTEYAEMAHGFLSSVCVWERERREQQQQLGICLKGPFGMQEFARWVYLLVT